MPNLNVTNTHENDVIFNMDSLREFIKLIKRQGTENIDFYAVSELLQPPSGLTTVVTNNGQEDDNLPYWIELYNNSDRIAAENALKNRFSGIDTSSPSNMYLYCNINTIVYQFTPYISQQSLILGADGKKYGIEAYSLNMENQESHFKKINTYNNIAQGTYIIKERWDNTQQSYYHTDDDVVTYSQNSQNNYNIAKICKIRLPFIEPETEYRNPTDESKPKYYMNIYSQSEINRLLNWISNDKSNSITLNEQIYYKESKFDEVINNINNSTDLLLAFIPDAVLNNIALVLNNYKAFNDQINIYSNTALRNIYINEQLLGSDIYNSDKPEWWNYIYTKYNNEYYIQTESDKIYYTEFNERELKENPGKIVIVRKNRPWNNEFWYNKYEKNTVDDNNEAWDMNIKIGRHLYVQAGSLLKFNPGQSTEDKDEIDTYWTDTTPGTFSIDENNGQKAHIITIRGFDQSGNFNNKNPIVGYTFQNAIPNDKDTNGAYKIGSDDYNLTPEQLAALQQQPDVPVYLNGTVIGYIKSKDIPKESNENGEYEINGQKYNLDSDSNLIIPLAQANIIPVYLNNNNASIASHEGNFDIINAGGSNGIEFGNDLLITSTTEAQRLPNDPNQGNIVDNKDNLIGSIKTLGGIAAGKSIKGYRIYAAVFNDYAECRKTINLEPGRVVTDNDDGSLNCANARLLPGAQVISDTYGNLIGEMPGAQTPIAVSGRVLVYPYQNRNNYHAGMAVCSAPNGTVDIMTREEIKEYPDCIIGIVSEIPDYKKWGTNQVNVDGRIWIKIK